MKLTKEERKSLQDLTKHPGWLVIKKLEQEAINSYGSKILFEMNTYDEVEIEKLKNTQLYIKARNDFVKNIEANCYEILENDIGKLF